MERTRAFLAALGLGFAVAGILMAASFDRLAGMICLVIGAFLLILPVISYHPDD